MNGSMTGLRFSVNDWWAWAPGRESRRAWRGWAGAEAAAVSDVAAPVLPMMLRRRATPFGQTMVAGALACGEAVSTARYVLASRHGELSRTLGILRAQSADDLPSPTEFSMSVHHGLAGLLSIHTGNRAGHTALAAGADSFGCGLLEAAAGIAERPDEPVLLIYGDEPLPDAYARFRDGDEGTLPLVVVLALGPAHDRTALTLRTRPIGDGPAGDGRVGDDMAGGGSPATSTALDFLRFFLSGAVAATSEGARLRWEWRRDA